MCITNSGIRNKLLHVSTDPLYLLICVLKQTKNFTTNLAIVNTVSMTHVFVITAVYRSLIITILNLTK